MKRPTIYTSLSPALLHLYNVRDCVVVVIDILRATSTIATALYNGAKEVIPVDSVEKCIRLGKEMACITWHDATRAICKSNGKNSRKP